MLRKTAAALAPALVVLGLFELALRLFPGLVPPTVGTAIYSVYSDRPGGIYFHDRPTRAMFMWPSYETEAYWAGYRWHHRTDALGFRNPPDLADRSLVLLGDSMIYGHGVEESDTVAQLLRTEHGLPAYNAARQGDSLYQEYLVARLLLPRLRPKTLVLTVFLNDFEDLRIYRKPEQIADPPELALDVDALVARREAPDQSSKLYRQLHRLKVWRLLQMAFEKATTPAPPDAPPGALPGFVQTMVDDATYLPIERYYEVVLGDLARRARETGTDLVLLHLDVGDRVVGGAIPAQDRVFAMLERIAARDGLRVLGTRALFAECPACFLPGDGHLTREGHARLAAFLAEALAKPNSR